MASFSFQRYFNRLICCLILFLNESAFITWNGTFAGGAHVQVHTFMHVHVQCKTLFIQEVFDFVVGTQNQDYVYVYL